ncbi:hypothetical protein ACWGB8_36795 [Kitasatospora sp. NPDC054939]
MAGTYWARGSSYYRPSRLDAADADDVEARYGQSELSAAGGGRGGLSTDL